MTNNLMTSASTDGKPLTLAPPPVGDTTTPAPVETPSMSEWVQVANERLGYDILHSELRGRAVVDGPERWKSLLDRLRRPKVVVTKDMLDPWAEETEQDEELFDKVESEDWPTQ